MSLKTLVLGGPLHGYFGDSSQGSIVHNWEPDYSGILPNGVRLSKPEFFPVRYTCREYHFEGRTADFFVCDHMPPAEANKRVLQHLRGVDPDPYPIDPRYVCGNCGVGGVRLWHLPGMRVLSENLRCSCCRSPHCYPFIFSGDELVIATDGPIWTRWSELPVNDRPLNWNEPDPVPS